MAAKKSAPAGTRLTDKNGTTVVVSTEKAARLLAGGGFSEVKTPTKSDSK